MSVYVNSIGTGVVTASNAVAYPLRSLRESASQGGYIMSRCNAGTAEREKATIEQNKLRFSSIYRRFVSELEIAISEFKQEVSYSNAEPIKAALSLALSDSRSFPEFRGYSFNGELVLGLDTPFSVVLSLNGSSLEFHFDCSTVLIYEGQVSPRVRYIVSGPSPENVVVQTLEESKQEATVSGLFIKSKLSAPKKWPYEGIVSYFADSEISTIPGFGAVDNSNSTSASEGSGTAQFSKYSVSESTIYNVYDVRAVKSGPYAEQALIKSNELYSEITRGALDGAQGLTKLAEGYGLSASESTYSNVLLDINHNRGSTLLRNRLRLNAYGTHQLLSQDDALNIMKLSAQFVPSLERLPFITISQLKELADAGWRSSYLYGAKADAICDSQGRRVIGLANGFVNAVRYEVSSTYDDETTEQVSDVNATLDLSDPGTTTNGAAAEDEPEGEHEESDTNPEQSRLQKISYIEKLKERRDLLEAKIGGTNYQKVSENLLRAQTDLDKVIDQVVDLQANQSVLSAQAAAILKQVAKVLVYPLVSPIYGQNCGILGDYCSISYDSSSRTFTVSMDKEAAAKKLASQARTSSRTKQCFTVYELYRGDIKKTTRWSNREAQEVVSSTPEEIRAGHHGIWYILDSESAANCNLTTSCKVFTYCTLKTKSKFFKSKQTITPQVDSKPMYCVGEDSFFTQWQNYLTRLLDSEVMKTAAGIAEVIEAAKVAISREANVVAEYKSQAQELVLLNTELGVVLSELRYEEEDLKYIPTRTAAGVEIIESSDKVLPIVKNRNQFILNSLNIVQTQTEESKNGQQNLANLTQQLNNYLLDENDLEGNLKTQCYKRGEKYFGVINSTSTFSAQIAFRKHSEESSDGQESDQVTQSRKVDVLNVKTGAVIASFNIATNLNFTMWGQQVQITCNLDTDTISASPETIAVSGLAEENKNPNLPAYLSSISSSIVEAMEESITTSVDKLEAERIGLQLDEAIKAFATVKHWTLEINGNNVLDESIEGFELQLDAVGLKAALSIDRSQAKKLILSVDKVSPLTEAGEYTVCVGGVYYTMTAFVRLMYDMGMSNKTTKAVVAKILDAINANDIEMATNIIESLALTAREEAVMENVLSESWATTEEIEYTLAGLFFLALDPSYSGDLKIQSLDTFNVTAPEDATEMDKLKLWSGLAVLSELLFNNNKLGV